MRRLAMLIALCLAGPGATLADHRPDAPWSWHIVSGGIGESRVSIFRRDRLIGIYDITCDLTMAVEGSRENAEATINLVDLDSNPAGLLLITCNVGAHSRQIAVIDLASKSTRPALVRTGSYFADWEVQDDELWISYDRPCDTGPTVECPDGYETVFEAFPGP